MKKYKDLHEDDKRRHEQALQRYQEDDMDEMGIINIHKRCNNRAMKVPQPKKASKSPKSDEPKKVLEPINDPNEEEQKPKKGSSPSDGKKVGTKAGKKVKKALQPKKAPKSPEFIDSSEKEEEGLPKDNKEKKNTSFAGGERRSPKFF